MGNISVILGQRIRSYRTKQNMSQEKLAEIAGCHPTYIGQIERGEKNATIESIEKIASALSVSLSALFENIGNESAEKENIPSLCYNLLLSKTPSEQEQLYNLILEIDKYKNAK